MKAIRVLHFHVSDRYTSINAIPEEEIKSTAIILHPLCVILYMYI